MAPRPAPLQDDDDDDDEAVRIRIAAAVGDDVEVDVDANAAPLRRNGRETLALAATTRPPLPHRLGMRQQQ
jgi:hypothetical protein